ncbi:Kiwa anti-phage protein KwaB-like domain-containing protein [Cytobacillus sp. FSL R5-0596]|uniref:Kiwa anti-phage protein KwaB-like domain-containing protein n=1 Tax=Cytobacillus sp. FSL R5-0596 TaxID=2954696 RepID=UPI0030F577BF
MQQQIEAFNQQFQPIMNTEQNAFRLYIVGKKLREGTVSAYDEVDPKEIIIDKSIQDWLLRTTKSMLSSLLEYELVNIQDVDEGGESIRRYIEMTELNQLAQWQEFIVQDQIEGNAHRLINDCDFKPKSLIASFRINDQTIYFLKVISESVLMKTRTIMNWNVARGQYELDENTNKRLFLDEQWDGIIFDNKVVLYNESKILSLFKYYEKFREAAEQVVENIKELGWISEEADLLRFIGSQVSLQKKLARASNYSFEGIQRERVVNLINQGTINLNLDEEGKIICTTKEEAKVVVDVILDNFVTSMITDERYRALNKSKL